MNDEKWDAVKEAIVARAKPGAMPSGERIIIEGTPVDCDAEPIRIQLVRGRATDEELRGLFNAMSRIYEIIGGEGVTFRVVGKETPE